MRLQCVLSKSGVHNYHSVGRFNYANSKKECELRINIKKSFVLFSLLAQVITWSYKWSESKTKRWKMCAVHERASPMQTEAKKWKQVLIMTEINWVTFEAETKLRKEEKGKSLIFRKIDGSSNFFGQTLESHEQAKKPPIHDEGLLGHCIVLLLGLRVRNHTCKAWNRQSITSSTANKCQSISKKCNIKEFHYQTDFPNEVSCIRFGFPSGRNR